jgi:hypothetical protein
MKRRKFKYPGDAAMQMFLRKHQCPTPFHVVRMRFLGEITSLKFDASPISTIESFWKGDLPVFAGEDNANAFFQTMMSLWNHMSRHQDGVLVKLVKPKKLRNWEEISSVFRMRAEEIRDGFMKGFALSDDQHLPGALSDAIHGLKECADRFDEAAERVQISRRDQDGLSLDDYRHIVEDRTREVEKLLTAVSKATTELRRLGIQATTEARA